MDYQLRVFVDGNEEYIELFPDETITMDLSFAEVQDITKKNSAFTQQFNVPGSKNNNYIFNYFFDFNQVPLDFTPTRKFEAEILYNGYIIASGYIRLNNVSIQKLNKTYNITKSHSVSLLQAAEMIVKIVGRGTIECRDKDADFPSRGALNIDAARKDFGYDPKVDVQEGFQNYFNWLSESSYWQSTL